MKTFDQLPSGNELDAAIAEEERQWALCAMDRLMDRLGYDASAFSEEDWQNFFADVRDGEKEPEGLIGALGRLEAKVAKEYGNLLVETKA